MASIFSHVFLLIFFYHLFISSSLAYARFGTNHQLESSKTAVSPERQVEEVARLLDVFPQNETNDVEDESFVVNTSRLIEKRIEISILSGSDDSANILAQYVGCYQLPNTNDARMFYYFFESWRSKNDPIVIWLSGGPGGSSSIALFYEHGPFHITKDLKFQKNHNSWVQVSNIIYVDQPLGTGFSFAKDYNDIRHNQTSASEDLYNFLQEFFKVRPQFIDNDFFIIGQSHAGNSGPALASRIQQGNRKNSGIQINLKGLAIGNGLTNPRIQFRAQLDYALREKLIENADKPFIEAVVSHCETSLEACDTGGEDACRVAYFDCLNIKGEILKIAENVNSYDIRKRCVGSKCYDFSNIEKFLSEKSVRETLGVGEVEFAILNNTVYLAMLGDMMKNHQVGMPALLENGIGVLIYAGDQDLICNWLGNSLWVNAMQWPGKKNFAEAGRVPFIVDGAIAGELQSHGHLSFLKVYRAGHMVPMDQPEVALHMIDNWMKGKLAMHQI